MQHYGQNRLLRFPSLVGARLGNSFSARMQNYRKNPFCCVSCLVCGKAWKCTDATLRSKPFAVFPEPCWWQGLEIHLVHGCNITVKTHFAVFPALFVARPGSVQMQHYGQNRLLFFPSLVGGKAWKFI